MTLTPVAVPPCEPTMAGRGFASGVRTAGVAAADCASPMRRGAVPTGWDGAASEAAAHAMTTTADGLDAAVAALVRGAAAADAFLDALEQLLRRHAELEERRANLVHRIALVAQAESRLTPDDDPSGLVAQAADLRRAVAEFDADVARWSADLVAAEDRMVTALEGADSVGEAAGLAGSAPDVQALAEGLLRRTGDPAAVLAWWRGLSRQERETLKLTAPGLVGNTDGIPVSDRDEANRAALSEDYNTLQQVEADGELTSADEAHLEKVAEMHRALRLNEGLTDEQTGEDVATYLMMYVPDTPHTGDGFAALAFGNPETADHVSVSVPGFSSTMTSFAGVAGDAANVFESAQAAGDGSVASIAWLGYEAPDFEPSLNAFDHADLLMVGGELAAADGARRLSGFIDGLRVTDQGEQSHLTVVGHSYGSTTVAKAAGDGLPVDDTVLLGSPGAGAGNEHAGDLSGRVWVGASDDDFVTHLGNPTVGGLGNDPSATDFGATRFRVDSQGEFALTPHGVKTGLENHTSYYDDATEMYDEGRGSQSSASLDNVARIVAGEGHDVEVVAGREENTAEWLLRERVETDVETVRDTGTWVLDRGADVTEHVVRTADRVSDGANDLVHGGLRLADRAEDHAPWNW